MLWMLLPLLLLLVALTDAWVLMGVIKEHPKPMGKSSTHCPSSGGTHTPQEKRT